MSPYRSVLTKDYSGYQTDSLQRLVRCNAEGCTHQGTDYAACWHHRRAGLQGQIDELIAERDQLPMECTELPSEDELRRLIPIEHQPGATCSGCGHLHQFHGMNPETWGGGCSACTNFRQALDEQRCVVFQRNGWPANCCWAGQL